MSERDDDLVARLRDFAAEQDDTLERLDVLFTALRQTDAQQSEQIDIDAMWARVVERWESIEGQ